MNKFDETAQQQKVFLEESTEPRTKNQEQRADTLSTAGKDMPSDGIDEGGVRFKMFGDLAFNLD